MELLDGRAGYISTRLRIADSRITAAPTDFFLGNIVATRRAEAFMAHDELEDDKDMTVLPLPGTETEAEHARIRSSNDRDQKLEREGKIAPHNRGYDEAAKGSSTPDPEVARVIDE